VLHVGERVRVLDRTRSLPVTPLSPAIEALKAARERLEQAGQAVAEIASTPPRERLLIEGTELIARAVQCMVLVLEEALAPPDMNAATRQALESEVSRLRAALGYYANGGTGGEWARGALARRSDAEDV